MAWKCFASCLRGFDCRRFDCKSSQSLSFHLMWEEVLRCLPRGFIAILSYHRHGVECPHLTYLPLSTASPRWLCMALPFWFPLQIQYEAEMWAEKSYWIKLSLHYVCCGLSRFSSMPRSGSIDRSENPKRNKNCIRKQHNNLSNSIELKTPHRQTWNKKTKKAEKMFTARPALEDEGRAKAGKKTLKTIKSKSDKIENNSRP